MFKFLRKYNKWILAVGGTLLMITFLIPQAINRLGQHAAMSTASRASIAGHDISAVEADRAYRQFNIIKKLTDMGMGIRTAIPPKDHWHWYLLVQEAKAAGLIGPRKLPVSDQMIQMLVAQTDETWPLISETLADMDGVNQLVSAYRTGIAPSDQSLKRFAGRMFLALNVEMVVLEPQDLDSISAPTEEQLIAHFDKYKDVEPGAGERGFGYRLGNRVKLEWISVNRDSVRKTVEQSDAFSPINQRTYWLETTDKGFPAHSPDIEVPQVVRDAMLDELTLKKLEKIERFGSQQLQLSRRGLSGTDGYIELPADWEQRSLSLEKLAEMIRQNPDFAGVELPAYTSIGDRWVPMTEIGELTGLGTAATDKFGKSMRLADLVGSAKEFGGHSAALIQARVAGPAIRDSKGNLYFFRITEADAARAPTSVDEVREQMVKDLKRQAAYEQLAANLPQIEQDARAKGMLALALDHDTVVQPSRQMYLRHSGYARQALGADERMAQFYRQILNMPSSLPVIGQDEKVIRTVVDRAMSLSSDVAFDGVPEDQTTLAVPVPDKLAILVVRLTGQSPLDSGTYQELVQGGMVQQMMLQELLDSGLTSETAFSFDTLSQRYGFKYEAPQTDEEDDSAPPKDAAAKAG